MRVWQSDSAAQTQALGRELAEELAPDGILLLSGALGAGKTVLVRGLAQGLGIEPNEVQSPTYTLMREHSVPVGGSASRLVHVDLYRLEPEEVSRAGIEEALFGPGVKAVEWAERLLFAPEGALALTLERDGEKRTIRERLSAEIAPARR